MFFSARERAVAPENTKKFLLGKRYDEIEKKSALSLLLRAAHKMFSSYIAISSDRISSRSFFPSCFFPTGGLIAERAIERRRKANLSSFSSSFNEGSFAYSGIARTVGQSWYRYCNHVCLFLFSYFSITCSHSLMKTLACSRSSATRIGNVPTCFHRFVKSALCSWYAVSGCTWIICN